MQKPIRTLLIEDEPLAASRLCKMLDELQLGIEVIAQLDTVSSSVQWFENNEAPDLIFLDIQLGDGISFDIFKTITIQSFIVFTTAYDQFAIKAFELNSIDYLLKPIDKLLLRNAVNKYIKLKAMGVGTDMSLLLNMLGKQQATYKQRFMVCVGERIKSVELTTVSFFYSLEKSTFLVTITGEQYAVDYSLDKLETLVDPFTFFRVNRQYLVHFNAIDKMLALSGSRIQIKLKPLITDAVRVSASRTHAFRNWLDR
jgi:DNA-binding LytR/AlgR family response regulator